MFTISLIYPFVEKSIFCSYKTEKNPIKQPVCNMNRSYFLKAWVLSLPMLELFEVDGGDKINGFTIWTGSFGLIKSMMSGGDSGCFCGKAISLLCSMLLLLLLWFQYLWHWLSTNYFLAGKGTHNSLTPYTHTPKTFFFFSWNRKNLYGLHFDERSFGGDTAAGWSKGFSLSFLTLTFRT